MRCGGEGLRQAAGRGGFLAAVVGPVEEDTAAARQAEVRVLLCRLENWGAGPELAGADRTRGGRGRNRGGEWYVWRRGMVPCRPLADQRGTFGSALAAQRRIDVAALWPRSR